MLKGTLNGSYRKNGNKVYTYIVSGTPTELANYRAAKGEYNRDTEKGEPIFFLTEFDASGEKRLIEPSISLITTQNNRVVVDDTAAEQSLMRDIKQHLAPAIAQEKAKAWIRKTTTPQVASQAPATVKSEKLPSTEEMLNETQPEVQEGTETIAG